MKLEFKKAQIEIDKEPQFDITVINDNLEEAKKDSYNIVKNFFLNEANIGLFFGTFDPLHNGHISIAKYFLNELLLDQIWFVITPLSPFKHANKVSNYYSRFKIMKNFCKNNDRIICSDVEFKLKPPYNTSETLKFLKEEHPNKEFKK